jgi:hypothetical protein
MIPERAAVYVLAVVCVFFQALRPSRMISAQHWRSVDVRIGWLRVQARNCADSVYFEQSIQGRDEAPCLSEGRISLLRSQPSHHRRLSICMNDGGCMTAWMHETAHDWSMFKDR